MARAHASATPPPIPADARTHPSWPETMLEMAAHIGAYDTLRIVEAFAGQTIYVPADPALSPFTAIVGADKAAILAHVYRRERVPIPVGRNALQRARRESVIAAIRAEKLTVTAGAAMLGTTRRFLSRQVNQSDEGEGVVPFAPPPRQRDDRQLEMFAAEPADP